MSGQTAVALWEVANQGEAARAILSRAGLDYCCEGQAPFAEACKRVGLDPVEINRQIAASGSMPSADWAREGVSALLSFLFETVHPRTKRALGELVNAAASLPTDEAARAIRLAVEALATHAQRQMGEEERSLFADVRSLAHARNGRGPFPARLRTLHEHGDRLREGHAKTHEYLRQLRTLVTDVAGHSGDELRALVDAASVTLTEQMHLENNFLLPRGMDLEPRRLQSD